jgi:hypothetical protein
MDSSYQTKTGSLFRLNPADLGEAQDGRQTLAVGIIKDGRHVVYYNERLDVGLPSAYQKRQ